MHWLGLHPRSNARDLAIVARFPCRLRASVKAPPGYDIGGIVCVAGLAPCLAIVAHYGRGDDEIGQSGHRAMALNARQAREFFRSHRSLNVR